MRLLILSCSLGFGIVQGNPIGESTGLWRRQFGTGNNDTGNNGAGNSNGNSSNSGQFRLWIPLLVCLAAFVLFFFFTWARRRFSRYDALSTQGAAPRGVEGAPDAAELNVVGQIPRRSRRPRRTPSQISTKSLPAYMKEPGDNEVVVIRGPQDMEDAPMREPMPVVHEDDGNSFASEHSEAQETPLLHSHDLAPLSPQTPHDNARISAETYGTSDESSLLFRPPTYPPGQDTRGDAPPYYQVSLDDPFIPPRDTSRNSAAQGPESSTPRRSGIRSFFGMLSPSNHQRDTAQSPEGLTSPTSPGHVRASSSVSSASPTNNAASGLRAPFRAFTRSSLSGPDSQSQISLGPISAPLTHTAVRAEFTLPRGGPTPEQVKLISSRDNIARFGVPYGPDAVAYAASNSRQSLGPPPDFDAVAVAPPLSASSTLSSGSSHQRGLSSTWTPSHDRVTSDARAASLRSHTRSASHSSIASSTLQSSLPARSAAGADAASRRTPDRDAYIASIRRASAGRAEWPTADDDDKKPSVHSPSPSPRSEMQLPTPFQSPLPSARTDSRASSVNSFATAQETQRAPDEDV